MKTLIRLYKKWLWLSLFAIPALTQAESLRPQPGWVGFDWLHPQTAQCTVLTDKLITRFKSCEHKLNGGFSGEVETYRCAINKNVEYTVFQDTKTCQKEFEIMQANGD